MSLFPFQDKVIVLKCRNRFTVYLDNSCIFYHIYNVAKQVTPRKLTIALEGEDSAEEILSVKAGSKIEDFKADVRNAVKLKDGSRDFNGLQSVCSHSLHHGG